MLDLTLDNERAWDNSLEPIGEGGWEKEPFETWWERNQAKLSNLHPRIAEQLIYRHWTQAYSYYLRRPELISWRLDAWPSSQILSDVRLEFGGPMNPDNDYLAFNGPHGGLTPTARALNQGTWDIPLLILETPNGIRSREGEEMPDVRFIVAEGSKRMRYLNALYHRGEAPGPHEVFIIQSPDAE